MDVIKEKIFSDDIDSLLTFLDKKKGVGLSVVTLHSEMFWQAYISKSRTHDLEGVDVILADGLWLSKALKFWGIGNEKITGIDLATRVAKESSSEVFFWGGQEDFNKQIIKQFGFAGGCEGYESTFGEVLKKIQAAETKIVLVGIGGMNGARQIELVKNLADKGFVAITVGGAFEVLSGRKKRAPKSVQSLGLEAAWRLALEPKRIFRVHRLLGFIILVPYLKIKCLIL